MKAGALGTDSLALFAFSGNVWPTLPKPETVGSQGTGGSFPLEGPVNKLSVKKNELRGLYNLQLTARGIRNLVSSGLGGGFPMLAVRELIWKG